jgi:hypothetical protein
MIPYQRDTAAAGDVTLFMNEQKANGFKDTETIRYQTVFLKPHLRVSSTWTNHWCCSQIGLTGTG